ncbi:MAG: hypothetical protein JST54_35465 [Deltaproteobacteria bacterium]|nr:hypothetical protein [Deltaproteobacteria bacterium]
MNLSGAISPSFSGRFGLRVLDFLSVGIRGQVALGKNKPSPACFSQTSCAYSYPPGIYRAWSAFPELRLSLTRGHVEGDVALGAGVGSVLGFVPFWADSESPGPFFQGALGVRWNFERVPLYVRLEIGLQLYTDVQVPAGPNLGRCDPTIIQNSPWGPSEISVTCASYVLMPQLLLNIGYRAVAH